MASHNTKPSRLKKLFRRERQRAAVQASAEENGTAAPPAAPNGNIPFTAPKANGTDRLEAAEKRG